jgi:hypothetical protein
MADDGQAAQQAAAHGAEQEAQQGTGGQDAGAGAQPPAWKTMGIPAHMLKDTPEDTLGEVFKGYRGFLEKQSAQGPVGKSPDDYKLEFGDALKPYFTAADDPALKAFQTAAHELGLPVKTANAIINKVFEPLVREGKLPPPFNPQAEIDGIAKILGKSGADAAPAIEQATAEMEGWAKNVGKQLQLSDGEQVEFESLMLSANGFGLLRKLQGAAGGDGFRLGGEKPSAKTKEEVFAMFNDPRANVRDPRFDQKFLDQAEAEMERLRQAAQR